MKRAPVSTCLALAGALATATSGTARAGGFEMPDNGAEALGRGGAFVAKADDPTAIQYNPAGLAGQHGTRLLFDGKLVNSNYSFQRFGNYPNDANHPWGGQPFPQVNDQGGVFFAPFIAATTDFGALDWLTVGVGVFGPSSVGGRTYPYGVGTGFPSPARYDVVQPKALIALPTASVGVRVTDWLDLGVGVHFVYGNFNLSSTSFVDLGDGKAGPCQYYEATNCDSLTTISATGTSWAVSGGAIVHPTRALSFGASVRSPISIDATGQASVDPNITIIKPPPAPGNATFHTDLPWYLRAGARYAVLEGDGFEAGDLELDATYETWGSSQGVGPTIHIDHLGPTGAAFDNIDVTIAHHYNDTFSIRGGGAYNVKVPFGVVALRGGLYYDKSATSSDPSYTRMDFDTLDKIAGTLGVGLKWNGFTFNLGYAEVFEPGRTVAQGTGNVRPVDGAQHGQPVDSMGNLLPAVNEGQYSGHTEIFSFGVVAVFDEVIGTDRSKTWANAKPLIAPQPKSAPSKDDEKKPDDDKSDESDGKKSDGESP
jgi:long-chain fatty acid transport protein